MKKVIFLTLGAAGILLITYYVIPNNPNSKIGKFKAQALEFLTGRTVQIKNSFEEILPKSDLQKERETLLGDLKNNLQELETRVGQRKDTISGIKNEVANLKLENNVSSSPNLSALSNQEIIKNTENIINKLKSNNGGQSIIERITDKVFDLVLPAKETKVECP